MTDALLITEHAGTVRFSVRVVPRASRSAIEGVHGGAIKIRLHAPPVDGAANDALVDLLADALGVARRAIEIVSGAHGRTKVIGVTGITRERVQLLVLK